MPRLAALILFLLCPQLLRAQQVLYITSGNGSQSQLYTVNPSDAQATLIGDVRIGLAGVTITGLAFQPGTGLLFGVTGNEYTPSRQLVTIDLLTAAATSLGTIGASALEIANDITFAANGDLFGWTSRGGPLVSLDPTNAARTVIGSAANGTQSNGLAFTPNGMLYLAGPSGPGDLFTVDLVTGIITSVAALTNVPVNFGRVNAMASDQSGMLFATGSGSSNDLVMIDPINGIMTSVGVMSFGAADALAFQPAAVPEPSTYAAIAGLVALSLAAWRRRQLAA